MIELEDVTIARGGREVLRGVSLRARPGEVTALVGPSGAGKSSLLRCVVRLDEPTGGRIAVDGRDVREWEPCALRRRVGFVAQAPAMLPGDVRANLAFGLEALGDADAAATLRSVGLSDAFLDRDARQLSGGEAARVAIARALTREPTALLLDEPTAALDRAAAAGVEALVADLAARGLTVLLVSHDEPQAARVARCAVRLGDARLVAAGTVAEVLER